MDSGGLKEACIRWGTDPVCEGAIIRGKDTPDDILPWAVLNRSNCRLGCGLWTLVDRRKHKFNRICQAVPMCPRLRAHWRNLANTI